MKFNKYPSIENTYRKDFISRINPDDYNISYSIMEKVHGANSSFTYDGNEFRCAKRTSFIGDENFYNLQEFLDDVKEVLVTEYNRLCNIYPDLAQVTIYGEICGGSYPHESIKQDFTAKKVQQGVYYHPSNVWLAFDFCYETTDNKIVFYSTKEFYNLCEEHNIPTVPLLSIVPTLEMALDYPNDNLSIIGTEMYGFPQIENNIMEGVVIKPYEKDIWYGDHRLILKNKNEHFAEVSHQKKGNIQKEYSENMMQAINYVSQFINENRINNVFSHFSEDEISMNNFGNLIREINKDVIEEVEKEPNITNILTTSEHKLVSKIINKKVSVLLKTMLCKR